MPGSIPLRDLSTLTPGVKYTYFARHVEGPVNKGSVQPIDYQDKYTSLQPSISARYAIDDNWSAYAHAAKGFLAPPVDVFQVSTPGTLKPEITWNYQIGTSLRRDNVSFGADAYYINNKNQEAGAFIRKYLKDQDPEKVKWIGNNLATEKKEIRIIGVSGNIGQVKYTADEIKRILKSVIQDNPFKKGNSRNLTVIALVLIIGSSILPFMEARVVSEIIRVLQIANINFSYSVDSTMMFSGIIVLILAGVFQYGNYLQEEVDSTL